MLVAALTATSLSSQDATDPSSSNSVEVSQEQLRAIEKEIQTLREEASRLAAQENSLISTLDQYEVDVQVKSHEIEYFGLRQQKAQSDIADLQKQYSRQQDELTEQKAYLSGRLVEAYKLGRMNYLKLMLQAGSASDLLRAYQYITFLAREDQRRLQEYRDSMQTTEATRVRMEQESRNLERLKNDSEKAQQDLLRARTEKIRLLSAIQDQREMHLNALGELKVAASQLQSFFRQQDSGSVSEPQGVALEQYKGLLEWPVRGKILRGFGMQKHPRFGTTTMNNGIDISAEEGTAVRAVFAGQVVFSEWFKGYGKSIIILHPGGHYSLYAHNSELLVQRGETVQKGQVVAQVGSTGALSGPGLYFEIRYKEQPVNPLEWLKKY